MFVFANLISAAFSRAVSFSGLATEDAVVAALFTAVSLLLVVRWATRRAVSRSLANEAAKRDDAKPLPFEIRQPVMCGEITSDELAQFDGKDPALPIYVALRGRVFDVTRGYEFYGPTGPYDMFPGKDASRAFAKLDFGEEHLTGDLSGLSYGEMEALAEWEEKFESKYFDVGRVVPNPYLNSYPKPRRPGDPIPPEPPAPPPLTMSDAEASALKDAAKQALARLDAALNSPEARERTERAQAAAYAELQRVLGPSAAAAATGGRPELTSRGPI